MRSGIRDHVLILDFSARFVRLADDLLRNTGYAALTPRSVPDAVESFEGHRDQIALILAAADHAKLAGAMQSVEPGVPAFLFDANGKEPTGAEVSGPPRQPGLSSLGTFPEHPVPQ